MTPFVPTDEQRQQVELMAGMGLTRDEISTLIINPRTRRGIDRETLDKHFVAELDRGGPKLKAQVVQSLYRKAMGDGASAVQAAIWVTRCRYGWRGEDRFVHEVDPKSAGVLVVPAIAAAEEWIRRRREEDEGKPCPAEPQ